MEKQKRNNQSYNPIYKTNDQCFQYAVTAIIKHEEIRNDPQRITKIKPFTNKYNWKGINVSSQKDDWKNFENNNATICYDSKWKKMALSCSEKLSPLLKGITSQQKGDFYCLNWLDSFATKKTNLDHIKEYVKIENFVIQLCLLKKLKS